MAVVFPPKDEKTSPTFQRNEQGGVQLPVRTTAGLLPERTSTLALSPERPSALKSLGVAIGRTVTQPAEFVGRLGVTIGEKAAEAFPLGLSVSRETQEKVQQFEKGLRAPVGGGLVRERTPFKSGKEFAGEALEAALNLTAPVTGGAVGSQAFKQGLKFAAKRGIVEGALFGAGFGTAEGLKAEGNALDILEDAAIGTGIGVGVGVAVPILGAGGRRLLKSTGTGVRVGKDFITKRSKALTPEAIKNPARFLFSVESRLKKFGDVGESFVNTFKGIDDNTSRRSGLRMDEFDQAGLSRLTSQEAQLISDAAEGRITIDQLPDRVRPAFELFQKTSREIAEEAVDFNVQVKSRGRKIPFQPRENFFPHLVPNVDVLQRSRIPAANKVRNEIIDASVKRGDFPNREAAEEILDGWVEIQKSGGLGKINARENTFAQHLVESGQADNIDQALGMIDRFFKAGRLKKVGQLDFAREFDFPFYDPDARRVIPRWITSNFKRLEEIKGFGTSETAKLRGFSMTDAERAQRAMSQFGQRVRKQSGAKASKEFADLLNIITNAVDQPFAQSREDFSRILRTMNVPKLAFAQITNIGQNFNTFLAAGAPSFLKGIALSFTKRGQRLGTQSGATLESALREVQTKAGVANRWSDLFLKYTGFNLVERFNRRAAANVGKEFAISLFDRLKKDRGNPKAILTDLDLLGIDGNEALRRGFLTNEDILTAAKRMSDRTQFRAGPTDLPVAFQTPEGKILLQFKSFAFQQGKFLKDQLKKDIQNNNMKSVARTLLTLGIIFPMGGEVIADVKSLITGRERPTDALERYISNLMQAGGLGITSDLLESAREKRTLQAITGPTFGTLSRIADILANVDNLTDSDIKFLFNQFGVFRPIINRIFD